MNKTKAAKSGGREEPIDDPQLLQEAMATLHQQETEFPIKVEGTSTLPYASVVQHLDGAKKQFVLKLVRPLPPELAAGAQFRMVYAVGEQRFESLILFRGREAYLQYRFDLPTQMFHSDRRRHKRLPFRPRESAYVVAHSGVGSGIGVAGPLFNIGPGGLALRVDRVLRLEDQMRIPAGTAIFDRGRHFNRIRIQDLPRLPVLEVTGLVAHSTPRESEVVLGFDFVELDEATARQLNDCLAFREKISKGAASVAPRPEAASGEGKRAKAKEESTAPGETPASGTQPEAEEELAESPLLRLRRRTTRTLLVMPDPAEREPVADYLRQSGYFRLESAHDLDQAALQWSSGTGRSAPDLLVVDLSAGGDPADPVAAIRTLERQIKALGAIPAAVLCASPDPGLLMATGGGLRLLQRPPLPEDEEELWLGALDNLANLEE